MIEHNLNTRLVAKVAAEVGSFDIDRFLHTILTRILLAAQAQPHDLQLRAYTALVELSSQLHLIMEIGSNPL